MDYKLLILNLDKLLRYLDILCLMMANVTKHVMN